MEHKQMISLLAYNHPGVLMRITGLFARRGFNIDNITAGVTHDPRYSRITIVVVGDDAVACQVIHQVMKLEDVKEAIILPEEQAFCCELALIKVKAEPEERPALFTAARNYHATVVGVGSHTMTLQATAASDELDRLIAHLADRGVLETARTGMTALHAGDTVLQVHDEED